MRDLDGMSALLLFSPLPFFPFFLHYFQNDRLTLLLSNLDKFRNYQTVKYSDILKKLESAQEEVTSQAVSQFSGPQLDSEQFTSMHNDIREPLLEVNTTLSVSSPNGTERKKDVLMSEVIADAKKRANTAATELEQLWAD